MENTTQFKACRICKEAKSVSEFCSDSSRKDGLNNACSRCRSETRKKDPSEYLYSEASNKVFMDENGMKMCCMCQKSIHFSEFRRDKDRHDGLSSKCKSCSNAWHREYRKKNPGLREKYPSSAENSGDPATYVREQHLRKTYKITADEYHEILAKQCGGCAICGELKPGGRGAFHIDHDHKTGRVRGLLCACCNMGIGQLKDSPSILRLALKYLEQSETSPAEIQPQTVPETPVE